MVITVEIGLSDILDPNMVGREGSHGCGIRTEVSV